MGWKLSTEHRIRAGAALVIVFLLILATNMIDKHHFTEVKKSMTSIYEDRLMAKNYIYSISRQLTIKQNILQAGNWEEAYDINKKANDSIRTLMDNYSGTKLTEPESRHFTSLENRLNQLFQYEENFGKNESLNEELHLMNSSENYYTVIFEHLDALSAIQIKEGKRQLIFSNQAIDSSNLIAQIEIGVLILIGVLLQLLIFLKPLK